MIDAVGNPQSLLVLGGTSDIALAVAEKYASNRPMRIVLAARPSERLEAAAERLRKTGSTVVTVPFDAQGEAHDEVIEKAFAGRHRRHRVAARCGGDEGLDRCGTRGAEVGPGDWACGWRAGGGPATWS